MPPQLIDFLGFNESSSKKIDTAPILDFTPPVIPGPSQTPLQEATQATTTVNEKILAASKEARIVAKNVSSANISITTVATAKGQAERDIVNVSRRKVDTINANPISSFFRDLLGDDDFNANKQTAIANDAKVRFAGVQRGAASAISINNSRKASAEADLASLTARGTIREASQSSALRQAQFTNKKTQDVIENARNVANDKFNKKDKTRKFITDTAAKLAVIEQNKTTNDLNERKFRETARKNRFADIATSAKLDDKILQDRRTIQIAKDKLSVSMVNTAITFQRDVAIAEQRVFSNALATAAATRDEARLTLSGAQFDESKRSTGEVEKSRLQGTLLNAQGLMRLLLNDVDDRKQQLFANRLATAADKRSAEVNTRQIAESLRQVKRLEILVATTKASLIHSALVAEGLIDTRDKNIQTEEITKAAIDGFDLRLASQDTPEGNIEAALMAEKFPLIDLTRTDLFKSVADKQENTDLDMIKSRLDSKGTVAQNEANIKIAMDIFFRNEDIDIVSGVVLEHISDITPDGSVSINLPDGGAVTLTKGQLQRELAKRQKEFFARQIEQTNSNAARIQVTGNFNDETQLFEVAKGLTAAFGGQINTSEFTTLKAQLDATKDLILAPKGRFSSDSIKSLSMKTRIDSIIKNTLSTVPKEVASLAFDGVKNYLATTRKEIGPNKVETIIPNTGTFGFTPVQSASVVGAFLGVPTDPNTFAAPVFNALNAAIIQKTKAKNSKFDLSGKIDINTIINFTTAKTAKATIKLAIQEVMSNSNFIKALNDQLLVKEEISGLGVLLAEALPEFPALKQFVDASGTLKADLFGFTDEKTGIVTFDEKAFVVALVELDDRDMMSRLVELGQESFTEENIRRTQNFTETQFVSAANYTLLTGGRLPGDEIIKKIANFKNFVSNLMIQR